MPLPAIIDPTRPGRGMFGPIGARVYSTAFSLTESPISESGLWANNGIDWTPINTSGGVAFGTQTGGGFDDSYANLQGAWRPNVEIITTVFKGTTSGIQEVEHRYRCADSAHTSNCYEINFAHDGQYCDFVKWPGALGTQTSDFTFLVPTGTFSISGGVSNGDRLRSRIVGGTLTAWIDKGAGWVLIGSATDSSVGGGPALIGGAPGIGFFKTSGSGAMNQYCFTDLSVAEI
jgi:hypothetical protein